MHFITFKEDCTITGKDIPVKGNAYYLCENFNAAQYLGEQSNNAEVRKFEYTNQTIKFDSSKDWNGKKILFLRAGGYGDLLLTTPIFRQIKKNWSKCEIHVSTLEHRHEVFYQNQNIDELLEYPIRLGEALLYDSIICYEDLIELNPESRHKHALDLLADYTPIQLEDKHLDLILTDSERNWAISEFPLNGKKRIFVQLFASSPVRTYILMGQVIMYLCKKGYEVFVVGEGGKPVTSQIPQLGQYHFVDLLNLKEPISFRKACAVLSTCDCCVAPDSAHVHTSGALNIPCVAIYGSFDWKLRTKYYTKCYAIQGHGDCAPCFCHSRKSFELFPRDKKCNQSHPKICHVMGEIDPSRVVAKVEGII